MKVGIYSPYLPHHFGGGEKHILTSAWYLSQQHEVEVHIPSSVSDMADRIAKYEDLFALDLSQVRFIPSALGDRTSSAWNTWRLTGAYDAFLYLTDGSLFLSGARKNILHIQIPFQTPQNSPLDRLKLRNWTVKNTNSEFTREVVERTWKTEIKFVHYPYVRVAQEDTLPKKRKQIIAVGRFVAPNHATHSKGQEILIEALQRARENKKLQGISLTLVGSIEPGEVHAQYVEALKQQAQGLPVTFKHDIGFPELEKLYLESLLFWHAAGFGVDEALHPEKVEHFGMTTIEAMSRGCIPFVVPKGGGKEIITEGKNGFFFTHPGELVSETEDFLSLSTQKQQVLQKAAVTRAGDFSLERFCQTLDEMMGGV